MELHGARVLVTGASKGIGAELARAFAAAGANVALAARNVEALEALATELGGTVHPVDLTDPAQVEGFIVQVEADGGPIDVLVNNAGIETSCRIDLLDESAIVEVINLNLVAALRLSRQVLPGMLARNRGRVVNVSSLAGVTVFPSLSVYAATKAGLSHFSHAVRLDLKGSDVGVTLVEPGAVHTPMWDRVTADQHAGKVAARLRRLGMQSPLDPRRLATATVAAVRADKPSVRFPKSLSAMFWLENAPRRMSALLAAGIHPQRS